MARETLSQTTVTNKHTRGTGTVKVPLWADSSQVTLRSAGEEREVHHSQEGREGEIRRSHPKKGGWSGEWSRGSFQESPGRLTDAPEQECVLSSSLSPGEEPGLSVSKTDTQCQ